MKNPKSADQCFRIATLRTVLLSCLLLVFASMAVADTTWVAAGSVQGIWNSDNSPYMISEGNIQVEADSTLTITEGVRVVFEGAYTLRVFGLLQAFGTQTDSIYFTCDPDSTPGGWRGIRYNAATDGCEMLYCNIERSNSIGPFDQRYGGGVEIQNCSPVFTNCTFRDNNAVLDGGGVYTRDGGTPQFENCLFEDNSASTGGGMLCRTESSPMVLNCTFRGNTAVSGGGIAVESNSDLIATNCLFEGNSAELGGGFKCSYSTARPMLTNCIFAGNVADSSGAALYLRRTNGTLRHCVVYGNEVLSEGGGAILADTTSARILNTIISANRTGSGIHLNTASELTITGCNFSENDGGVFNGDTLAGFAVLARQNLNFDSCDVFDNIFLDPVFRAPQTGDYHLTENSPCIAAGLTLATLPADRDGFARPLPARTYPDQGAYENETGSPLQLCGEVVGQLDEEEYVVTCDLVIPQNDVLTIERNVSLLFAGDYKLVVNGELITRGLPDRPVLFSRYFDDESQWGGIEFIAASNHSDIQYVIIEFAHVNGQSDRLHGGGIYMDRCGPTFNGCIIRDCEALRATSEGGGIYVGSASNPKLRNCIIENNRSTMKGGGLSIATTLQTVLDNCTITGNESNLLGGGLYVHISEPVITSATIRDNYCGGKGGGVYFWWSPATISHSLVLNNTSDDEGGGLYVNSASPAITNCTVGGNLAVNGGGGITLNQSSAHIKNSIFYGNSGSGVEFTLNNTGAVFEYSDVFGNQPEDFTGTENAPEALGVIDTTNFNGDESDVYFNIMLDPQLADTAAQDYSLTANSPCINAGDPLDDFDPDTTLVDMGALYFEVEHNPPTAFSLLSPPDEVGADETNTVLTWQASFDEGTADLVPMYRVQVALDENFNNIVISQTIDETTLTVTTLDDSTDYWWRVLAVGSNGIARISNEVWSFYTVITHPSSPFELLFPFDEDTLSIIEPRLFCWQESREYDGGDFVVYEMNIEAEDTLVVYTDLTDTCLNVVPVLIGLNESGWIEWWVTASSNDPDTTIECEDRFVFWLQDTSTAISAITELPQEFALHANFPNPFNAVTTIAFDIPIESDVSLRILNIVGQEVTKLIGERYQPGKFQVDWNANGFSSGVYLAVLETGNHRWTTKMMLLK